MSGPRKICVCSVQVPFVRGGAELFAESLVSRLQERDFQVDRVQLPLQTLPLEEVLKGCFAWRLLNLDRIYNDDIDLVIGTKFPSYMVPHSRKIVWLVHQYREIYDLYDTPYCGFRKTSAHQRFREKLIDLDQRAFSEAKKIFTISKTVSGRLKDFNGLDSTPLYPPVDDAEHFAFHSMEDFVLSVSRLEGNKRVDLLIRAMTRVSPRFRAVIVGEGFLKPVYQRLAADLGVQDRILFRGALRRRELIDLYARCGALFYGPIGEDYGYATIEAFLSGKPVITCVDSGGVLEFVNAESGWITDCQPDRIAESIESALNSKARARERGENGRDRIRHINWGYALDRLLDAAGMS
jgi:glycosyltransferase involved in cell wall biosynthesis